MAANISTVPRAAAVPAHAPVLDAARVRRDFPILDRLVNGQPLVYLDSAASAQEPRQVLRAVEDYATQSHANVHRGVHALSQAATAAFEGARERVRRFINARSAREIIFTRGTTEAINLVAQAWARERLGPGDEILITALEHHANIVPWQMVREQTGCELKVAPIDRRGELLWDEFLKLLGPRTRLVAVAHVSNALGTVLPVERIVDAAHAAGALVLIDGAQAVPHTRVDVQALGADFYTFSGHKLYAPTGIGVLYGREELLAAMPPWQGGGDMILTRVVREDHVQRAAVQVRGRNAQHLRRGGTGGRDGLRRGPGAGCDRSSRAAAACRCDGASSPACRTSSSSARRLTRHPYCPSP